MGQLSINLEDYESKLERLNKLVKKMSSTDWTVESALQFCKDQGMQIEDYMPPQFETLQDVFSELNDFDYSGIRNTIVVCKKQIKELKRVKFDDYNVAYQNYINNLLSNKNNHLNVFFKTIIDTKRVVEFVYYS